MLRGVGNDKHGKTLAVVGPGKASLGGGLYRAGRVFPPDAGFFGLGEEGLGCPVSGKGGQSVRPVLAVLVTSLSKGGDLLRRYSRQQRQHRETLSALDNGQRSLGRLGTSLAPPGLCLRKDLDAD